MKLHGRLFPVKWSWLSGDTTLSAKVRFQRFLVGSRIFFRTLLSREKPSVSCTQWIQQTHIGLTRTPRPISKVRRASELWARVWNSCVHRRDTYAARLRREAAKYHALRSSERAPLFAFVGFTLAESATLLTQDDQLESVCIGIREMFNHSPKNERMNTPYDTSVPDEVNISHMDLGNVLAKGCNAVVYSAKWKTSCNGDKIGPPCEDMPCQTKGETETSDSRIHHSDEFSTVHQKRATVGAVTVGSLHPYNLAIKMMFNYDVESNALAIWKAMNKEIVPSRNCFFSRQQAPSYFREKERRKTLTPHPNIVEMYFTFADFIPALPEAKMLYPQALPLRLSLDGCGRNMTLFLVMRRYHCTLQEYLQLHKPSSYTSLLLLTQLLEGIVHLLHHGIAHRDLKTDNILLDLTHGLANPLLVIADFGCCLADDTIGLRLPFPSDEISRGGNSALMAPEVLNALPGRFASIDYSRADLWAAGAMAYEIYNHDNPFYSSSDSHIDSGDYHDSNLPPLGCHAPSVVQRLVVDLLRYNAKMRPSPSWAATVCQLLLHAPPEWLCLGAKLPDKKQVLEWIGTLAAVTYCQSRSKKSRVGPAEWQLRLTFLSRIQLNEVVQALKYISFP